MRSSKPDLHVEVIAAKIVVSLPESHYSVTYYKLELLPSCLQGASPIKRIPALRSPSSWLKRGSSPTTRRESSAV